MQVNRQNINGPNSIGSGTIHRTIVEHGVRVVGSNDGNSNGLSTNISTITAMTKQHTYDQKELQELNSKLALYLDHVLQLENFNGQLAAELESVKTKWSSGSNQLQRGYGPELKSLRNNIDSSLRDQIHQELLLKQYEYDIWQTQQRIAAVEGDLPQRLHAAQQELNQSIQDFDQIQNQFNRRTADVAQLRTNLGNLVNQFDALQAELLNHRLERIMVENELQTLREHGAFQDAIHEANREELLSLSTPAVDISQFYRNELGQAILDIRQDFEVLAQVQAKELEEYYRIKTEQIQERFAEQNERKRLAKLETETTEKNLNSSDGSDLEEDYNDLKAENIRLQAELDASLDDLERIQDENLRQRQKHDQELLFLQQEIENKQAVLDGASDSNVSLRFELSTYRQLLNVEEQRLTRSEQGPSLQNSSSSSGQNQNTPDYSMEKVAVTKAARGPIVFESFDFMNDCIIITNEKSTGADQSLGNWTIHRQNDKQSEIVYRFPSSFSIKPRQTIRIFSKRSPQSTNSGKDILIADQIDTWGQGQVMVTRLFDLYNDEKANITLTRIKA